MPERNVNLLLADTAQPANGLGLTNIIQWFGGRFVAVASGTFDGATVEVMFTAEAPLNGDTADYAANPANYDWISLHTFSAPGTYDLANLNPCGLAIRITGSVATSRIRVLVGSGELVPA